jgi:hypothetical protein
MQYQRGAKDPWRKILRRGSYKSCRGAWSERTRRYRISPSAATRVYFFTKAKMHHKRRRAESDLRRCLAHNIRTSALRLASGSLVFLFLAKEFSKMRHIVPINVTRRIKTILFLIQGVNYWMISFVWVDTYCHSRVCCMFFFYVFSNERRIDRVVNILRNESRKVAID